MSLLDKTRGQLGRGHGGGKLCAASMVVVGAMFMFACSDDDDDADTTSATTEEPATTTADTGDAGEQEEVTIDIVSISDAFEPETVTVGAGTEVTWVNTDDIAHTSTAEDDEWDSGTMAPDDEFTFTPETAGTYPYVCSIHPSMTGELVVE